MALRPSRISGDPVLHNPTRPVEVFDESLKAPVEDMFETMAAAEGVGLAANQVGALARVAVVEVRPGNPRYPYKPPWPLTVMVNPRLEPLGTLAISTPDQFRKQIRDETALLADVIRRSNIKAE